MFGALLFVAIHPEEGAVYRIFIARYYAKSGGKIELLPAVVTRPVLPLCILGWCGPGALSLPA